MRTDLLYALRTMRRHPAFAAVAILTIALGVAATTAVFSIVSTVLLRPLPFPDPDRLIIVGFTHPKRASPDPIPGMSIPRYRIWREQTDAFQDVAAYAYGSSVNFASGDRDEQVVMGRSTASFFHLFGVSAAQGRTYGEEEDRPHGPRVVLLSDGFCQRQYGGTSTAVGRTISLAGASYVVIGVLPATFETRSLNPVARALPEPDVWVPLQLDLNHTSDDNFLVVAARLRPGVSFETAQAQTKRAAAAYYRAFPDSYPPGGSLGIVPFEHLVVGEARAALLLLAASVACVLVITWVNTACLLLMRGSSRHRELAIRAATGASRGRLVRQLVTESLVLAGAGGALGLLLGLPGVYALLAMQPGHIPRLAPDGSNIVVDWPLLLFAIATTMASGVAAGLLPAWRVSRVDLETSLRSGGGRTGAGARHERARALLVIAEVALASLLLVSTTLVIRGFIALRHVDPGFDTHRLLTMETVVTEPRFAATNQTMQLVDDGIARASAVPGVEQATAALTGVPLRSGGTLKIEVAGAPPASGRDLVGVWNVVARDYFQATRIPLVRGRLFSTRDDNHALPVAIVNQTLARRLWPGGDPIGDRVLTGRGAGPDFIDVPRQVVGIVGDVRNWGLDDQLPPVVYIPFAQLPDNEMAIYNRLGAHVSWMVRTSPESYRSGPYQAATAIREALRDATHLPVAQVRSMDDVSTASTAGQRFEAWLMTLFGVSALLLAALGVYGVLAHAVQERTREIGIRVALGATTGEIRGLVLARGLMLTAIGIAVGMVSALGLTRLLSGILFGISPYDGVSFAIVPIALCLAALAAIWLPARRAARVDPVIALRAE
jgi:putative ABC transport system permease protein